MCYRWPGLSPSQLHLRRPRSSWLLLPSRARSSQPTNAHGPSEQRLTEFFQYCWRLSQPEPNITGQEKLTFPSRKSAIKICPPEDLGGQVLPQEVALVGFILTRQPFCQPQKSTVLIGQETLLLVFRMMVSGGFGALGREVLPSPEN